MKLLLRMLGSTALVGGGTAGLLAAAIALNALLLQASPHPSPLFVTRDPPAPSVPQDGGTEVVRDAQRALSRLGLYHGSVDGVAGAATTAAVQSFEKAAGLPATGAVTPALLASLDDALASLSAPATSPALPAKARRDGDKPDPDVAAVQRALDRAAYGPLDADGLPGQRTREAIGRFQADHGLEPTGEIDPRLIEKLRAVGAL
jgi:peptidoglycan hydrolase-like protein with peptidoglycan-binding domain